MSQRRRHANRPSLPPDAPLHKVLLHHQIPQAVSEALCGRTTEQLLERPVHAEDQAGGAKHVGAGDAGLPGRGLRGLGRGGVGHGGLPQAGG